MVNDLITEKEEKQILLTMASILKNNCENHTDCTDCPLLGRYKSYIGKICPISVGDNPCEWEIDQVN